MPVGSDEAGTDLASSPEVGVGRGALWLSTQHVKPDARCASGSGITRARSLTNMRSAAEARQYCQKALRELALGTGSFRDRLARARAEFAELSTDERAMSSFTSEERDYLDPILAINGWEAVMALDDGQADRLAHDIWLLCDCLSIARPVQEQ